MTELLELYALFAALYLLDCVVWVPRGTIGLLPTLRGRRVRPAYRPNPTWSVGAVFGSPWPPLTPPLIAELLPFVLTPAAVRLHAGGSVEIPWDALVAEAHGPRVEVRGPSAEAALSVSLATRRGALTLAESLTRIAATPAQGRAREIERLLAARFDDDDAATRWRDLQKSTRALRVAGSLLWLTLFVGLALVSLVQTASFLIALGAVVLVLWVTTSVTFVRTLRRQTWLPREAWPDLSKRVTAILSPLSAMRGTDLLARELLADVDPVAAAAGLAPPEALVALARVRLAALHFSTPEAKASDPAWWRDREREQIEALLRRRKQDPLTLLLPPPPEGPSMKVYCPICLTQYEGGNADEADRHCTGEECQGILLRSLR